MRRPKTTGIWAAATLLVWIVGVGRAQLYEQMSRSGSWGDQGNGHFVNPVLPGDFSDLDAIRVGGDFYAISSTMQYSPGMVVLHSKDLVNWEIVGHVVEDLTTLDPELGWERMDREGRGIWAGSLRYHAGQFWVFFGTPDGGIYKSTASTPDGPWSIPRLVLAGAGWDDPCPFWDDDGQGYLITTHFAPDKDGKTYRIHLLRMSEHGDSVDMASDRVVHQSAGSEANKLYKIDGMYLHYFSEVKPEGRVAMMERSRSLEGPWEVHQLNHVHGAVDKEPNQGGLIQLADGRWWFLTHQGRGDWEGRAGVLLPVTWIDGWPILGRPGADGIGEMVWGGQKPIAGKSRTAVFSDDDFQGPILRPQWEWRYQPRPHMWSLRDNELHLKAFSPLRAGFGGVRDVLTQRAIRTRQAEVTVELHLQGFVDGQEGGLAQFANTAGRLAVVQSAGVRRLERIDGQVRRLGPVVKTDAIWLRSRWDMQGIARFDYSLDGVSFIQLGGPYQLTWGAYRGDRIGLYTFVPQGAGGSAGFSSFHYAFTR